MVGETMRHALNTLAVATPEWLRAVSPPGWRGRDARRAEDDRLPTTQAARAALTRTIGHGGWPLLAAIDHPEAPPWLRTVPAIATLRREAADVFQAEYARRAGVEGTIPRGVWGPRPRRPRDIGVARVRLEHLLTAVGLNVLRLGERLLQTARAKTRLTPFVRLMADAPAA
jgi:hypothetical protein